MTILTRRKFLGTVLAGGAIAAVGRHAVSAEGPKAERPNLILVLVDDLGWAELGCYGNTFNETPNLDRLAREGIRFADAYAAAPVCSPTRASIMTGQYPARVGITNYLRADDAKHLSPERHMCIAKLLRARGYTTGLIGKWHLMGDYRTRKGDPALHGFEEVICSETKYIGGGDYLHPYHHLPGVPARGENEYLTDRLATEAVGFVERHQHEPFFLYLSHYSVHTRLDAPKDKVMKYESKPGAGKDRNNPVLAAMVESLDLGVGRIMDTLEQLGIADNTLLVFMSDNGGEHNVTSNTPLRGAKSQLYEGGIRVPLMMRWPKGIRQSASAIDVPVSSIDLFPTFLDAADVTPPVDPVVDGVSLMPLLAGAKRLDRDHLFWHYPLGKPHFLGGRSSGAVREGRLKLIEYYDTGVIELYDLESDPGEKWNLCEERPEDAERLLKTFHAWRETVKAVGSK